MKKKPRKWMKTVLYNLVVVFLILCGLEWYLASCMNDPADAPQFLKKALRTYYLDYDSNIIQLRPESAHYDSGLFYVLKTGTFEHNNREFTTTYHVNSAGVRDDEASLDFPKMIVLGDSYAMGWGVEQEETFASLLENKLNYKVLNAGVSSYGTAREIASLNKFNTDSLAYLIIQYCPNDLGENKRYVLSNNELHVSSKENYEKACLEHKSRSDYYFLKHIFTIPGYMYPKEKGNYPQTEESLALDKINGEAAFLTIVRQSLNLPAHTKIIVFTLEAEYVNNSFIRDVQALLQKDYSSALTDQMSFVDLTGHIDSSHRFVLDPHLNAAGHEVIADLLLQQVQTLEMDTGYTIKTWHYPSGPKSITCEYENGIKNGLFKTYWENGSVSRISHYNRGIKSGWEVNYDTLGVASDSVFFDAKKHN